MNNKEKNEDKILITNSVDGVIKLWEGNNFCLMKTESDSSDPEIF